MKQSKQNFLTGAMCGLLAMASVANAATGGDAVDAAHKADQAAGIAAPGIVETAVIAEPGFIYDFPS